MTKNKKVNNNSSKHYKQSHVDRRKYRQILHEIRDNSHYLQGIMNSEECALLYIQQLIDDEKSCN